MIKLDEIPRPDDRLLEAVESVEPHDHVCLLYRDNDEGLFSSIAFIKVGLKQNDQCVYIADDNSSAKVAETMKQQDVEVEREEKNGQLVIGTKKDAYLQDGSFDPDKAIKFFAKAANEAKKQGYRCMRGAAEMTWQLGGDPGCERLLEYETRMNNELFPNHPAVGLCQYNIDRFLPDVIREVIYTHPKVIIGGLVCKNFYYKPPEEYVMSDNPEKAEQEVVRMIKNIYEFEKSEVELRQSKQALQAERNSLDKKVQERTAQLEDKANQLKRANVNMVGREYRIKELENENEHLKFRLDQVVDEKPGKIK